MGYKLKYTRQADKDARLLERAKLDSSAIELLSIIKKQSIPEPAALRKAKGRLQGLVFMVH